MQVPGHSPPRKLGHKSQVLKPPLKNGACPDKAKGLEPSDSSPLVAGASGGVEPLGTCCNQAVFVETPTILGHCKSMIFNGFRCKMLDFRWIMKFVRPQSGPDMMKRRCLLHKRCWHGRFTHSTHRWRNHSATGSIIRPNEAGPVLGEFRDMGESPVSGCFRWPGILLWACRKAGFRADSGPGRCTRKVHYRVAGGYRRLMFWGSLHGRGRGVPHPSRLVFSWAIRRGLCCCGMVGLSVSVFLVFPTVCRLAWWCVVGWLRVLASFLFPVFGGDEV